MTTSMVKRALAWVVTFACLAYSAMPTSASEAEEGASAQPGANSVASAVVPTNYLLVSSFECANPGCNADDAVLRYNATTGQYLGVLVSGIDGPYGLAIRPVTETLLVVSSNENLVNEYNATTGTFIRTFISAGAEGLYAPQAILVKADGNILVTSTQTTGNYDKFNGILEYDGQTGEFIGPFVDGGFILDNDETCGDPRCLRGPNGMAFGPNGHLYATSSINSLIIEYDGVTGAYINYFDSGRLISPVGIVARPAGTTREGNLLVTSKCQNPTTGGCGSTTNDFSQSIVEFDKNTHELIFTGSGVYARQLVNVGPLRWRLNGNVMYGERHVPPSLNIDKVKQRHPTTGANLGDVLAANDTHAHFITALLEITVGGVSHDCDGDNDVDMIDFAKFQRCFGQISLPECLGAFDDNVSGAIGYGDLLAFAQKFHGPRRSCGAAADCNDGSICTADTCVAGTCEYAPASEGASCADSLFCNGQETCQGGLCTSPQQPCIDQAHCVESSDTCLSCLTNAECNDGNPCRNDVCIVGVGCQHTNNNLPCNDGNLCTTNDTCSGGACVGGPPPNCNDNNACTTDSCNLESGCIHVHNLNFCSDGSICSEGDQCLLGECRPGPMQDCSDGNPCTSDTCDPIDGCENPPNPLPCNDGNACTANDTCSAGSCVGMPLDCSDGITCTVDTCANGVCQHAPNNGLCTDGIFCNGAETCNPALGCQPGTAPCNDGISCTADSCNEDSDQCNHTPNNAACSNGQFCDGQEFCDLVLGCRSGSPPNCNDGIGCTTDSCNEGNDTCVHAPNNALCIDAFACTIDSCNPATGCQNTPNHAACADGNFCNGVEACVGGVCTSPGNPCPAGDLCCESSDTCVEECCSNSGCASDGNFCNGNEVCVGGVCASAGNPCPPGDLCCESSDTCVDECCNNSQCLDDGNFCNGDVVCVGGVCTPTDDPCEPGELCCENLDTCAAECCANSDCPDDGNFCNSGEVCTNGVCTSTGSPCLPIEICCEITDSCAAECCDDIDCLDDDIFCNGDEVCVSGGCISTGVPCLSSQVCCEDLESCEDECCENSDCPDDGDFCNGNEVCVAGSCTSTGDPCGGQMCCEGLETCVDECCNDNDCPGNQICDEGTGTCMPE